MSFRDTIERYKPVVIGMSVLAILVAMYIAYRQTTDNYSLGRAYYSTDDGKSWFADDETKAAPFMVGGKEALRAYVVRCEGKTFVGMLEKYTPAAKERIEKIKSEGGADAKMRLSSVTAAANTRLYREPGRKEWLPDASSIMVKIQTCKDAQLVNP